MYSKEEINKFTDSISDMYLLHENRIAQQPKINPKMIAIQERELVIVAPIELWDLLICNSSCLNLLDSSDPWDHTIHKKNFTALVANNPSIIYKAFELYGDFAIKQINSKVGYKTKEKRDFTMQEFWFSQREVIRRYHKLIDRLLLLGDNQLEYFITTNTDNASSYDFQTWLEDIEYLEDTILYTKYYRVNRHSRYPGDLLCLTRRTFEAFPEWNPRRFLTEAKKISTVLIEKIDKNIFMGDKELIKKYQKDLFNNYRFKTEEEIREEEIEIEIED